jgi:hypothetical protein
MNEDYLYLLFCYLIFVLTLGVFAIRSNNCLRILTINLLIAVFYSTLFFYQLAYNSSGGSGLVWLVSLMFAIGIHWLINFVGLLLTLRGK